MARCYQCFCATPLQGGQGGKLPPWILGKSPDYPPGLPQITTFLDYPPGLPPWLRGSAKTLIEGIQNLVS